MLTDLMDTTNTYKQLYRKTTLSVVSVHLIPKKLDGRAFGTGGSGFVFDEQGYIVTNAHVVRDASEVELRFGEGEWRTGTVAGIDVYTDLAVIYVNELPEYAVPLPIARDNPEPGEPVAAFGNPMGLDGTMTTGVISGTGRSTPTGNGFTIPDTIQTDAAINPGNSGGPLVTIEGKVVGVNRAKSGDNIGFAISARIVNRVVPTLIEFGVYRHSYIQIRTIDVSPTVAEANGLEEPAGVLVVDIGPGPARSALIESHGIRRIRGRDIPIGGDVIIGIDGIMINTHEELIRYLVTETQPGQIVRLALIRNGSQLTERIELVERPPLLTQRSSRDVSVTR